MMPLFHGKMSQSATARPARPIPPVLHRAPDPQDRAIDLGWTGRHFLLLGPFADLQDELCSWIVDVGAQASMTGALLPSVHWVARRADKFDAVLLDADHIGAVETLVETGFDLRRVAPQLPVVILSSQVSCHDFSRERQAICDATLRRPLSRSAFFLRVSAAQSNRADAQMSRAQA